MITRRAGGWRCSAFKCVEVAVASDCVIPSVSRRASPYSSRKLEIDLGPLQTASRSTYGKQVARRGVSREGRVVTYHV